MFSITSAIKRKDVICFYAINRKLHCRKLDIFMKGITNVGSMIFAVSISLFCLAVYRKLGLMLILNLISSQSIIHILKRVVNRPRPYKTLDWAIAVNPPKCKYSLPSGHSGSALSISLVLSSLIPTFGFVLISLAICVGISRIYLGFHYPIDVSTGFIISYIIFQLISCLVFI